ncbi:MAG: outer membrane protein assembly factor BamE [Piscirickettsiaceae bacterium]|nr:outer membrane protein assembly factor BamE [Piscirickettsiaceae bacterium]
MKNVLIYTFSILILIISGCSKDKIPGVYRIDIQQGNDVTQEMINKLKPEMTKHQVSYVMGTPLIIDVFHPDRWDYLYSFHPGNGKREQRRITLFFESDKLTHIEGDTRTVAREDLPQVIKTDTNVVVPLTEKKTSLFQNLLNSIGLGDDDDPESIEITNDKPTEDITPSSETAETSAQ